MERGTKNGEKPNMDSIRISTDSMVKRRLDANINHFYEKFHFYKQFYFYILLFYLTDLPEIVYHVFHTDIFLHRQQNRYVRLAIYTDRLTLISKKSSKRKLKKTEKIWIYGDSGFYQKHFIYVYELTNSHYFIVKSTIFWIEYHHVKTSKNSLVYIFFFQF